MSLTLMNIVMICLKPRATFWKPNMKSQPIQSCDATNASYMVAMPRTWQNILQIHQAILWKALVSNGGHSSRYWRRWCISQQRRCIHRWLEKPSKSTRYRIRTSTQQQSCGQSAQMWMGSSGKWLAWLLVDSYWTQTLANAAAQRNYTTTTRVAMNSSFNRLPGNLASHRDMVLTKGWRAVCHTTDPYQWYSSTAYRRLYYRKNKHLTYQTIQILKVFHHGFIVFSFCFLIFIKPVWWRSFELLMQCTHMIPWKFRPASEIFVQSLEWLWIIIILILHNG